MNKRCWLVALALGGAACGDSPNAPAGGSVAAVSRIEIVAPGTIAPAESVQLTVRAITTGGTIPNVTAGVQWTSSSDALQITPQGVATGKAPGEALITAQLDGRTATASVLVLPRGTFKLSGRVINFSDRRSIGDAALTVLTGTGTGQRAVSTDTGAFSLYGLAGDVTIRVEKSGYTLAFVPFTITTHLVQDVVMRPGGHLGTYTLTIHTGSCNAPFPDSAKRRDYEAEVSHETGPFGGRLAFAFPGPNFIVTSGVGNAFYGSITPRDAVLNVQYYPVCEEYGEVCGYQLVERFNDDALAVDGQGWGTGNFDAASGPFRGEIVIFDETRAPFNTVKSRCRTDRFELRRR